MVQLQRLAITKGSPSSSPMASFVSANASEDAPAAHPKSAIAQSSGALGARAILRFATCANAEELTLLTPYC